MVGFRHELNLLSTREAGKSFILELSHSNAGTAEILGKACEAHSLNNPIEEKLNFLQDLLRCR